MVAVLIKEEFREVLNKCFPLPPRNVPELLEGEMARYPTELIYSYLEERIIGGTALHELQDGVYYINWCCILPELQRQGFGRELLTKVHNTHRGMILLRSVNSTGFWQSLGYEIFLSRKHRDYLFRIVGGRNE